MSEIVVKIANHCRRRRTRMSPATSAAAATAASGCTRSQHVDKCNCTAAPLLSSTWNTVYPLSANGNANTANRARAECMLVSSNAHFT